MIIHKCDRCGKTTEQKAGEQANLSGGWTSLQFAISYSSPNRIYEICPDCRIALKIPESSTEGKDNIGDRLIEIIEELVQEQLDN